MALMSRQSRPGLIRRVAIFQILIFVPPAQVSAQSLSIACGIFWPRGFLSFSNSFSLGAIALLPN
jgi:hypothetical protein